MAWHRTGATTVAGGALLLRLEPGDIGTLTIITAVMAMVLGACCYLYGTIENDRRRAGRSTPIPWALQLAALGVTTLAATGAALSL